MPSVGPSCRGGRSRCRVSSSSGRDLGRRASKRALSSRHGSRRSSSEQSSMHGRAPRIEPVSRSPRRCAGAAPRSRGRRPAMATLSDSADRHGDRHQLVDRRRDVGGEPVRLVAEHDRDGHGEVDVVVAVRRGCARPDPSHAPARRRCRARTPASGDTAQAREEQRAGRRPHALRVERSTPAADHHRAGARRLGTRGRACRGCRDRRSHEHDERTVDVAAGRRSATTRWRPTATIGRGVHGRSPPARARPSATPVRGTSIDAGTSTRRRRRTKTVLERPRPRDSASRDEHRPSIDERPRLRSRAPRSRRESPQTLDLRVVRAESGQEACCFADSLGDGVRRLLIDAAAASLPPRRARRTPPGRSRRGRRAPCGRPRPRRRFRPAMNRL